jgi:hypothetical protein
MRVPAKVWEDVVDPQNPNLGLIVDFAAGRPGRQAQIVYEQYKMLNDPERRPQDFYRIAVKAIKEAVTSTDPDRVFASALTRVEGNASKLRHYQALFDGFRRSWRSVDTIVPLQAGVFRLKTVGMRVNPQLGVRNRSGQLSAVFLYLKDNSVTKEDVQPILFAMNEVMDTVLPGARPRILNVRTGEYLDVDRRTNPQRQRLRIAGLLGQWTAMWQQVAEAA